MEGGEFHVSTEIRNLGVPTSRTFAVDSLGTDERATLSPRW